MIRIIISALICTGIIFFPSMSYCEKGSRHKTAPSHEEAGEGPEGGMHETEGPREMPEEMPEDMPEEEEVMTVHPNVIRSVDCLVEKKGETLRIEFTFMDEDEIPCLTNGRLTLRWKKRMLTGYDGNEKPVYEFEKAKHLKNKEFAPGDFKGSALRIRFKARKIEKGDIILLEWYGFEVESDVQ